MLSGDLSAWRNIEYWPQFPHGAPDVNRAGQVMLDRHMMRPFEAPDFFFFSFVAAPARFRLSHDPAEERLLHVAVGFVRGRLANLFGP